MKNRIKKFKFTNKKGMVAEFASYQVNPEAFNNVIRVLDLVEKLVNENGGYISRAFDVVLERVKIPADIKTVILEIQNAVETTNSMRYEKALKKVKR